MRKKRNNKKLFKNKIQMFIYLILFAICIFLFIVIGKTDYTKNELPDAIKFSNTFKSVPENNLYVYATSSDVYNIINKQSGIILMGFSKNKWVEEYASILNDVAMNYKIDKLYYYDFEKDRDDNNGTYEAIVNKLINYAPSNDKGEREIYAPTVVIVKNGNVIAYFDETTFIKGDITSKEYYSEENYVKTYNQFKEAILEYLW